MDYSFNATLNWQKHLGYVGFAGVPADRAGRGPGNQAFVWGGGPGGFNLPGVSRNAGVYALYYNTTVNYVGKADDLADRLGDHYKEVFLCCDNQVLTNIQYFWAETALFNQADVEAILIRLARIRNPNTRNVQNAAPGSVTIGFGVNINIYNTGKVPNFLKHNYNAAMPAVAANRVCPGVTQPHVYHGGPPPAPAVLIHG